ncbi:GATA transcription factor 15-like isoform X2 [Amaranthus tricolor]|uniref:GATA transcription factor 15-like isoform X2 n=1 Tax=Amaranthus tricolor TaxID=29722 RepID=UPI00258D017C|nr:GATA transcription factor 15-like isoform X2 [Amaranthus tricolor]
MLDLKEECSVSESQSSNNELKRCACCQTTTTPLWRGGPAGPKSLCNACGIKYHKRRRALLGLNNGRVDKNNGKKIGSNGSLAMPLKIKIIASEIRQSNDNFRDKLGEVEQAAMLLMALSCGSVYA